MKKHNRRILKPGARRAAERGVALVLVMIFLALMLLLGLATTMTSITEVNAGRNYKLATESFAVADAGASHAYELVSNMQGDFTFLLRGEDDDLKTGDEFQNGPGNYFRSFKLDGSILQTETGDMFDTGEVAEVPLVDCADSIPRALYKVDALHYYELIPYDNAHDDKSYLDDAQNEVDRDTIVVDETLDADQRILVRSIGYVMGSPIEDPTDFDPDLAISSSVVDVVIGLVPYPAIITDNDLRIANSVAITGSLGGVHANDDLDLDTGNFEIEQSATFSNTIGDTLPDTDANATDDPLNHIEGYTGPSGALYIPDLNPFDTTSTETMYIRQHCDYICVTPGSSAQDRTALLNAMGGNAAAVYGTITAPAGNAIIFANDRNLASGGPTYSLVTGAAGTSNSANPYLPKVPGTAILVDNSNRLRVDIPSNNRVSLDEIPNDIGGRGAAVFVLMPKATATNEKVTMNGGTDGQITIITNGSVHLNGNAALSPSITLPTPELPPWNEVDLLVLAGMDITMNGTAGAGDQLEGVMYAHEAFSLGGTGYIVGQVVAKDVELQWDAGSSTYVSDTTSPISRHTTNSPVGAGASEVTGNFQVFHNIARGYLGNFAQLAWRQLRDYKPVDSSR